MYSLAYRLATKLPDRQNGIEYSKSEHPVGRSQLNVSDINREQTNPYHPPEAELQDSSNSVGNDQAFFIVSTRKLFLMFVLTLGLYVVVWFYHHFKRIKQSAGEPTWPVARAIFYVFFTHSLFKRIHHAASSNGIRTDWAHFWYASAFVLLSVIGGISHRSNASGWLEILWLVLIPFSVWILVKVQATSNTVLGDPRGQANHRLTALNYIWIVVGLVAWLGAVLTLAEIVGFIEPIE